MYKNTKKIINDMEESELQKKITFNDNGEDYDAEDLFDFGTVSTASSLFSNFEIWTELANLRDEKTGVKEDEGSLDTEKLGKNFGLLLKYIKVTSVFLDLSKLTKVATLSFINVLYDNYKEDLANYNISSVKDFYFLYFETLKPLIIEGFKNKCIPSDFSNSNYSTVESLFNRYASYNSLDFEFESNRFTKDIRFDNLSTSFSDFMRPSNALIEKYKDLSIDKVKQGTKYVTKYLMDEFSNKDKLSSGLKLNDEVSRAYKDNISSELTKLIEDNDIEEITFEQLQILVERIVVEYYLSFNFYANITNSMYVALFDVVNPLFDIKSEKYEIILFNMLMNKIKEINDASDKADSNITVENFDDKFIDITDTETKDTIQEFFIDKFGNYVCYDDLHLAKNELLINYLGTNSTLIEAESDS